MLKKMANMAFKIVGSTYFIMTCITLLLFYSSVQGVLDGELSLSIAASFAAGMVMIQVILLLLLFVQKVVTVVCSRKESVRRGRELMREWNEKREQQPCP